MDLNIKVEVLRLNVLALDAPELTLRRDLIIHSWGKGVGISPTSSSCLWLKKLPLVLCTLRNDHKLASAVVVVDIESQGSDRSGSSLFICDQSLIVELEARSYARTVTGCSRVGGC